MAMSPIPSLIRGNKNIAPASLPCICGVSLLSCEVRQLWARPAAKFPCTTPPTPPPCPETITERTIASGTTDPVREGTAVLTQGGRQAPCTEPHETAISHCPPLMVQNIFPAPTERRTELPPVPLAALLLKQLLVVSVWMCRYC